MEKLGHGEYTRADVSAPYRSLVFPLLELILITGVVWIAIGWADVNVFNPLVHNGLVILWGLLAAWRFLLPVVRARRKRFIVTNQRVIAREGKRMASVPLGDIAGVRRRRGGISLAIRGYDRAMYFPELPKNRKLERVIDDAVQEYRDPIWG